MRAEDRVRYLIRAATRAELDGNLRAATVFRRAAEELLVDVGGYRAVLPAPGSVRE